MTPERALHYAFVVELLPQTLKLVGSPSRALSCAPGVDRCECGCAGRFQSGIRVVASQASARV